MQLTRARNFGIELSKINIEIQWIPLPYQKNNNLLQHCNIQKVSLYTTYLISVIASTIAALKVLSVMVNSYKFVFTQSKYSVSP